MARITVNSLRCYDKGFRCISHFLVPLLIILILEQIFGHYKKPDEKLEIFGHYKKLENKSLNFFFLDNLFHYLSRSLVVEFVGSTYKLVVPDIFTEYMIDRYFGLETCFVMQS